MNHRKSRVLPTIAITAVMMAVAIIVCYPFLWWLVSTFKSDQSMLSYPPSLFSKHYTFDAYAQVFQEIPLPRLFLNTLIFAGVVSSVSVFIDSMAGYAFARIRFKGRKPLFLLVLFTLLIPFQIIMIPLYIEVYRLGILNTYAGLILPHASSPFAIYLMRSFFVGLPKDLEEAGRIDGVSEFGIYWKILLPLCTTALITLFIFNFMYNWNDLLYPLMMTSTNQTRTLPAGLAMFVGERVIQYGPSLAASLISILPLIVAYIFAQRYFVRSVAISGLK